MKIGEMVKDSLVYALSDWKKLLVLGFILMFSTLGYTFESLGLGISFMLV